ncbi:hypothetical protein [Clostridium chrysemydis]|uniref:hypothetical protein n=1 Tax=Clostridium chrysemydis TaxID=2665504 RepID=UPI001883C7F6|nr:hypothetical protein [Clostridium chrysemydis]
MGKQIFGFSVEDSVGYIEATCIIERKPNVLDEFVTPYEGFEVLIDVDEETEENIYAVAVNGADKLLKVIDKEDCLPDVGLLDYENNDLKLNLKDVTLRQLYKEVLIKVLR